MARAVPRKLQALLCDIDDTLFSTSDFAERARRNAIRTMIEHGLEADEETAYRELIEVIGEFSSNYASHFDKLLVRLPREKYYPNVNPAILIAAGVIGYHETKSLELRPFPDVLAGLRRLARTTLTLGVVSAGLQTKQAEKLIRLGLYRYFRPDAIFISDQIGIGKPNPKLWTHACAALGLDPREVMYVGDHPTHDIDPCNELGIVTVRCRRGRRSKDSSGKTEPRYEIESFDELVEILRRDFKIKVPPEA
jgi:putative hydrolase of the HAD superfamily